MSKSKSQVLLRFFGNALSRHKWMAYNSYNNELGSITI